MEACEAGSMFENLLPSNIEGKWCAMFKGLVSSTENSTYILAYNTWENVLIITTTDFHNVNITVFLLVKCLETIFQPL